MDAVSADLDAVAGVTYGCGNFLYLRLVIGERPALMHAQQAVVKVARQAVLFAGQVHNASRNIGFADGAACVRADLGGEDVGNAKLAGDAD